MITLSIVSHRQGALLGPLLGDIQYFCGAQPLAVILTLNLPESLPFDPGSFAYPLRILENDCPRGFGPTHNRAFALARGEFFGILNPDLRLTADPLPPLCALLSGNPRIGVAAPRIVNAAGETEDNARRFPTPAMILRRILARRTIPEYALQPQPFSVDWLAGMFLFFPHPVFSRINGFDERYFLYGEDLDLGARLRLAGFESFLHPGIAVIHEARRHSHRNPTYLKWHLISLARFFNSEVFKALRRRTL